MTTFLYALIMTSIINNAKFVELMTTTIVARRKRKSTRESPNKNDLILGRINTHARKKNSRVYKAGW